jgi:hypothetical protein
MVTELRYFCDGIFFTAVDEQFLLIMVLEILMDFLYDGGMWFGGGLFIKKETKALNSWDLLLG